MGNRAMIMSKNRYDYAKCVDNVMVPVVYIHWADRDEVEGWLQRMKEEEYRSFTSDPSYALARLCQIACEDYPNGRNVGIMAINPKEDPAEYFLDEGYWIVDGYEIVETVPPHY